MPAETDSALHVALHRDVNPLRRQAALEQSVDGEAHHDLGAADECRRQPGPAAPHARRAWAPRRRGPASRRRLRRPSRRRRPCSSSSRAAPCRAGLQASARRRAASRVPYSPRRAQRVEEHRAKRRKADSAGDDQRRRRRRRPRSATRCRTGPRKPSTCPGSDAHTARVTAPTERTVSTTAPGPVRRTADRDRHLADRRRRRPS